MPLITCPDCCHYPVSTQAERCPKCGMPVEKMLEQANSETDNSTNGVDSGYAKACRRAQDLCAAGVKEAELKSAVQEIRQLTSSLSIADRIESAKQTSILVLTDGAVDFLRDLHDEACVDIKELHVLGDYKVGNQLAQYLYRLLNLDVLDIALSNFEMDYNVQKLPTISTLGLRFCPKIQGSFLQKYLRDELACLASLNLDGNRQIGAEHILVFLHQYGDNLSEYSVAGCSIARDVEQTMSFLIQKMELGTTVTTRFK